MPYHHSLKHLKWQKFHRNEYIDINIHKHKYKGSRNVLPNPKLEIHNVDAEDEVEYRLEVATELYIIHSNAISLKVMCVSG